jgi:microcystin-dependent protein
MSEFVKTPRLEAAEMPISTLALTQLLDTNGDYPVRGPGQGPSTNVLAMVHTLAGSYPAFGAPSCAGQIYPIAQNQALFSLLGPAFGGNGQVNFALPNLHGRVAVGGEPGMMTGQSLAMTWMIAAAGLAGQPSSYPMTGALGLFAGNAPPPGWLAADGSLFPISQQIPLFQAIGATFGGNGASNFAVPDLRGRTVVGAGQGATATIALGQVVEAGPDTPVACVGCNYIVNVSGSPAPNQGKGGFPAMASVLAEVVAFAGASIPPDWVPAAGQEMLIAGNENLFEIIGTTFGGDGQNSFALPDLRTRMVTGG